MEPTTDVNSFAAALELAQSLKELPTLEAVVLFGSAARAEMTKKSDIDLLLLFDTDHNPESGEEGKTIFKRAIEIERKYKLENPFSLVFLNIGEDVDAEFVWEVVRDGTVLYYRHPPEGILGKEGYLSPAVLISYTFEGVPQKDRVHVNRVLYGYRSKKVHNGKEYLSERKGIIPRYGRKLGRATFIVDARIGEEVQRLFDEKNVLYTATRIWSTKSQAQIVDMKDLKKRRFDFLRTLYEETGGDTWDMNRTVADIGKMLQSSSDEAEKIARYLHDEGLIEIVDKDLHIRILHAGIREVEGALSHPDKPTVHFPATDIINFNSREAIQLRVKEESQIALSSPEGVRLDGLNNDDYRAITDDFVRIKERIGQLKLPSKQETDLCTEIETIETQTKSSKSEREIIKASFDSMKKILEAGTGSAAYATLSFLSDLRSLQDKLLTSSKKSELINLEGLQLTLTCPSCHTDNVVTYGELKARDDIVCKGCGITIRLEKDESFLNIGRNVEKALNDFKKSLESLDQSINVKL
jgi:predicted nucleotidyltransferase